MYIFFFNDTATTEIYTLSLHDALPIYSGFIHMMTWLPQERLGSAITNIHHAAQILEETVSYIKERKAFGQSVGSFQHNRSEEHTSELQSRQYLVCRLLLEKKKTKIYTN